MNSTLDITKALEILPAGQLWIANSGRVTCLTHGGMYLTASVIADPQSKIHDTPLDNWMALSMKETEEYGLTCETCDHA
jgi:hypothetical protein